MQGSRALFSVTGTNVAKEWIFTSKSGNRSTLFFIFEIVFPFFSVLKMVR